MGNPYRELLRTPDVMGLVIASSIARLPQAMIGIGIITMLVQQSGLYWLAGAVAGTFTLANALISPQVSKLVDPWGQSKVLPFVTAFSIAILLALMSAAHMRVSALLLFILAALAGTVPSMPAMIRARWTQLFRSKPQLHTAFSLDTVLTELAFIVGPPLTIGLSTTVFAEAGPLVAVLLLVIGVTAFLLQRQTEPKVTMSSRRSGSSTLRIPWPSYHRSGACGDGGDWWINRRGCRCVRQRTRLANGRQFHPCSIRARLDGCGSDVRRAKDFLVD